ncbi:helix-turn-helix transcriptional regulator, partial [Streptomyces sp. YIM 98790]|uniref:helix-turn-helix domain-containing protein n=1 Tax=Streptomyces sp. YIM 98790 TaxID=2689077 RepID=UPI00140A2B5E
MSDMRVEDHVKALAEALRELKERTPHSYDTLAVRLNVSRSALHRYCTGKAVPPDFQLVELLAGMCGADEREVARLNRRWTLARESQPPAEEPAAPGPQPTAGTDGGGGSGGGEGAVSA